MKEQFVSYEIALKLKELGFDEPCFGLYKNEILYRDYETFQWNEFSNCIKAPLWQQVEQFLRNKYNLIILYNTTPSFDSIYPSKYQSAIHAPFNPFKWTTGKYYIGDTFEDAREQAIIKAIELCKRRK